MGNLFWGTGFKPRKGEYKSGEHWYCPDCREPVTRFSDKPELAGKLIPRNCKCSRERLAEKGKETEADLKVKTEERRARSFGCTMEKPSKRMKYTFAADDGRSPEVTSALKAYCANFEFHKQAGKGYIIQSAQNGSGKTFFACAVANELIDRGYSVFVTDFLTLRDKLGDPKSFKDGNRVFVNKVDFLQSLLSYDLIVIDDLGAENATSYTLEGEYYITDYLTDKNIPLIITTNYTKQELIKEENRDKRRVFDRLFGCCGIITVDQPDGRSRRLERCAELTRELTAQGAGAKKP
jgi:DNA replication protein DnaC